MNGILEACELWILLVKLAYEKERNEKRFISVMKKIIRFKEAKLEIFMISKQLYIQSFRQVHF